MENDTMKKCPYCAEQIRAEAIKCRYCGSDLTKKGINLDFLKAPGYWHRVNEGKKSEVFAPVFPGSSSHPYLLCRSGSSL